MPTESTTAESPPTWNRKRVFVGLFKLTIVVLVVWGIGHTLGKGWSDLADYQWSVSWKWLIASSGLYLAGLFFSAFFWRRILISLGERPGWYETIRAYYVGHLGKYVPGKAMVIILRVGLLRSVRIGPVTAGVSVLLETLTMMAVGACLSGLLVVYYLGWQNRLAWLAAGLFLAAVIPTLPPVFRFLVGRLKPITRENDSGQLERVSYRLVAVGWLANVVGWTLMGLSLWAVLRAIGVPQSDLNSQMPRLVAAVALAVVAGFLSLLPGGVGVRDWVLAELLIPIPEIGQTTAIVATLLLRLVWLVSEVGISGILYTLRPKQTDSVKDARQVDTD